MLSFSAKGSDTHNENNHMAQHTSPPPAEETRTWRGAVRRIPHAALHQTNAGSVGGVWCLDTDIDIGTDRYTDTRPRTHTRQVRSQAQPGHPTAHAQARHQERKSCPSVPKAQTRITKTITWHNTRLRHPLRKHAPACAIEVEASRSLVANERRTR